jgi:PAS domain S-box-containing protein
MVEFKKSDQLFETILQYITDPVVLIDKDCKILWANKAFQNHSGYEIKETIDNYCYRLTHHSETPCNLPDHLCPIVEVQKTGRAATVTHTHFDKKGNKLFIEIMAYPVNDEKGEIIQFVYIYRDITEHKGAEEALRESERLLACSQEISHLGSWELDLVNKKLTWSDEVYRIFGLQPQEFGATYEAFLEAIHPDDRAAVDTAYSGSLREGRDTYEIEHRIIRKSDGEIRIVHEKCEHIRDSSGQIIKSVGMVQDITERKRLQDVVKLRLDLMEYAGTHSLEELLQKTLDEIGALTNSPIGFYHFVEPDQKTLSLQAWSTRTVKEFCTAKGKGMHYGIDKAGVWVDCVRERRPVIHNDYLSLPYRKGLPEGHAAVIRELVVPIIHKDNIVAILGVGNKPIDYTDKDVELVSFIADVAWEITKRKQAEEEIQKLNKELKQKLLELTEANKELDAFNYTVSHDLKVPLFIIGGFINRFLKKQSNTLDTNEKDMFHAIQKHTKEMERLIKDLLTFSRVGRQKIKPTEIDVGNLVTTVLDELKPLSEGKIIKYGIKTLPTAYCDQALIKQVFVNLLSNAIKFTTNKKTAVIEIGGWTEENENVYYVKDNGVGFNSEDSDKLFAVFQRLHGVEELEGSGVGLSIVQRIVKRHGGRLWAEGKVNGGASFYFSLSNRISADP